MASKSDLLFYLDALQITDSEVIDIVSPIIMLPLPSPRSVLY
jgi:hypothetical protein